MTRAECEAVLDVVAGCDGSCVSCVGEATEVLLRLLPGEPWREVVEAGLAGSGDDCWNGFDRETWARWGLAAGIVDG